MRILLDKNYQSQQNFQSRNLLIKYPYGGYRIYSDSELGDVFIDGKISSGVKSYIIELMGAGKEHVDEVLCLFEERNKEDAVRLYRKFRKAVNLVKTTPGETIHFEMQ